MKKLTILFFMTILPLMVSADAVEIDGIYYNLNTSGNTAEVIKKTDKYTGSVNIPKTVIHDDVTYNVSSIGKGAFKDCTGLTDITIPNSVTSIGKEAFYECKSLTEMTIPNSVTEIGSSAFYSCSGLTSVIISNSLTSIGDYAFGFCKGLTSVTIPNSVTSIGGNAFAYCSGLTSIEIPNSVTSIGNEAFESCSGLTSVTIPNNVTSIGGNAFAYCSNLTSITIPNGLISLGDFAFSVTAWDYNLPDGLHYIGKVVYKYKGTMPDNTSISIKEGTVAIAGQAFNGCFGLTSVTIPNSVTSIGNNAFSSCDGLTSVTCEATEVPSTGSYVFNNVSQSSATLYVPTSALESYKATSPWSGFGSIVALPDPTLRGDVNEDGIVNGTDIQAIINLIVESEYDEKGDVNEDGQVNGTDIQEIINIIVNEE